MTIAADPNWLKTVDSALAQLDEKPQFGLPTTFPVKEVETLFRKLFNHNELTLSYLQKGWLEPDKFWEGLGEQLVSLTIEMTPIEKPLYFVLSQQDLGELMSDLLVAEQTSAVFCDPEITSGFYHYLALEVMQTIEETKFAHPLSPRVGTTVANFKEVIAKEHAFVIDTTLELKKRNIWGRLFISASFRSELKRHFASTPLVSRVGGDFPLILTFEVGYTELTQKDFGALSEGDYLLLDHCSFDPMENKGSITIMLANTPLFRGKVKKGGIEIAAYPRHEELGGTMEDDDVPEFPTQFPAEEGGSAAGGPAAEPNEEPFPNEPQPPGALPAEGKVAIGQLPVQVKVEVGRVRMTLAELSALSVGNLLELDVTPEQGVDLVVSGKKIGKGELIRIGETLGVRIISI